MEPETLALVIFVGSITVVILFGVFLFLIVPLRNKKKIKANGKKNDPFIGEKIRFLNNDLRIEFEITNISRTDCGLYLRGIVRARLNPGNKCIYIQRLHSRFAGVRESGFVISYRTPSGNIMTWTIDHPGNSPDHPLIPVLIEEIECIEQ